MRFEAGNFYKIYFKGVEHIINQTLSVPILFTAGVVRYIWFTVINNVLTLLPTFSNPIINTEIDQKIKEGIAKNILRLNFNFTYENIPLHFVIYYDKVLLMSDSMRSGKVKNVIGLLITDDGMRILRQTTDTEYENIKNDKQHVINEIEIKDI